MATALSAHLLRHYCTRSHRFQDYEDGLPKQKLRQAIEYIQTHLSENLSLTDIANQLGISQYYFCHLFKRSTGMSPHQFLIRQRIDQAKQLLRQPERTITSIAMECGFANQSHFARYFRQYRSFVTLGRGKVEIGSMIVKGNSARESIHKRN